MLCPVSPSGPSLGILYEVETEGRSHPLLSNTGGRPHTALSTDFEALQTLQNQTEEQKV